MIFKKIVLSFQSFIIYLRKNKNPKTMKRNFIIMIFALCSIFAIGQNPIPNAGFESWVNDNQPQSWYGLYMDYLFTQIHTLSKTTDAQNGSFAALVETKDAVLLTLPGIACLSPMNLDILGGTGLTFTTAGAPVSVRPTKILGHMKYSGVNGDTAMIAAIFTKWNPTTSTRDTLGMYGIMVSTVVSSYTPFEFNTNLSQTPDSMNILLVSSAGYAPQLGSALFVDNLSMEYTSTQGVETVQLIGGSAYPNPATDEIIFSLPEEGVSTVRIFDISGRLVGSSIHQTSQFFLDVRTLETGMYQIIIEQNGRSYMHKTHIIR